MNSLSGSLAAQRAIVPTGRAAPSQSGESVTGIGDSIDQTLLSSDSKNLEQSNWLKRSFLPSGFPQSVHPDYLPHRNWMFVHEAASGATSYYATQALLGAMGFGAIGPLSAAMTWMLRDGIGALGNLGSSSVARDVDRDPPTWKVRGELLCAAGKISETALSVFPQAFPVVAPLGNLLDVGGSAIKGTAAATIEQHQAITNNLGEVHAKNSNQSILASAAGIALGAGLQNVVHLGPAELTCLAVITSAVALVSQLKAAAALRFNELSDSTIPRIVDQLLSPEGLKQGPDVQSLQELLSQITRPNPPVEMGVAIEPLLAHPESFEKLRSLYGENPYLLAADLTGKVQVVLRPDISPAQLVQARAQAHVFQRLRDSPAYAQVQKQEGPEAARDWAVETSWRATPPDAEGLLAHLSAHGWNAQRVLLPSDTARCQWRLPEPKDTPVQAPLSWQQLGELLASAGLPA